jgi:hypothetical protein
MKIAPIALLGLVLPLLLTAPVSAVLVLDNLTGTTPSGTLNFKGTGGFLPYQEIGITLQVDNSSDFQLDSITFDFGGAINTSSPAEVSLWTTGSGSPQGTLIATLTGPGNPSNILATYSPASTVLLSAGAEVFVVLRVPTGSGFYRLDGTADPFVVEDWSFGGAYLRSLTGPWTGIANVPGLQIHATAVPEPAGAAALGIAALLFGARRKRR